MVAHLASSGEFITHAKSRMDSSGVVHHSFLERFEFQRLSRDQLRRFAIQWYKTARAHKRAFPVLVYNTVDDDVRFELIDILNEEYGSGNRDMIHGRLLLRFLAALGISEEDVDDAAALPCVSVFSQEVLATWRDAEPVRAFGLHFALEYLAASLHAHFSRGLKKYPFLSADQRLYFDYHEVAEQRHADFSELGMETYARDSSNRALLDVGIDQGIRLMTSLWTGFEEHVLTEPEAKTRV